MKRPLLQVTALLGATLETLPAFSGESAPPGALFFMIILPLSLMGLWMVSVKYIYFQYLMKQVAKRMLFKWSVVISACSTSAVLLLISKLEAILDKVSLEGDISRIIVLFIAAYFCSALVEWPVLYWLQRRHSQIGAWSLMKHAFRFNGVGYGGLAAFAIVFFLAFA